MYGQPGNPQPGYGQPAHGQPGQPNYAYGYAPGQPQQAPPPYSAAGGPATQPTATTYTYDYGTPINQDGDDDGGGIMSSDFGEKSVRAAFLRKVYSLLCGQLLISIGIVCLFIFHTPTKVFVKRHPGTFYAAWGVTLVIMIVIACFEKPRRKFPLNLGLLGLFTLAEGYLLGVISAFYKRDEVLLAMGIVAVVSLAITIFAFQTKYDFTMMGGCLFVALIILICFGFLTIFFYSRIMSLIYACLGALIFAMYLVFDTQIMMGGGKAYSISPEEYIFAALNLYIDIVTLFIYILSIIGLARAD
ncbi:protein lifeguard 1-like [Rhopilema esculentum]|uniref:protein lifeguard 1-like n=1 Tax=Rhopilema esculentum TaxID=499914 RepID=UPI0031E2617D